MAKTRNLLAEIKRQGKHVFRQVIYGANKRTPSEKSEADYRNWCYEGSRKGHK